MKCDRCGKRREHHISPSRLHDYAFYLAKQKLLNLCDRCDGELHWEFAEAVRASAVGAEREEEAGRVGEIAGAMGADPPQSVRQGVAGRGPGGVAAISTAALGEGVTEALSPGAVRGVDGKVQAVRGDEGGLCGNDGATEEGDAPGVRALRLDPDEIGKFDIIYADPPWHYRGQVQHGGANMGYTSGSRAFYPTIPVKELMEFPIRSIAADSCLLYLWATSPCMEDAFAVGKAWGFKYATFAFVWDKQRVNPGHYTMSQTETCLVFKRGKVPLPRGARNVRQLVREPRTTHSRKPEEVRVRIEKMHPAQRKIELFARGAVAPGWHAWGNEVQE